jgi:ABC-type transport system involved in Fe-S cluster assembly fused permease/ATPase subunit
VESVKQNIEMNVELKNFKYIQNYRVKNLGPELAVDVRNVVFGYKKNLKILNNINVQIPKGMSF